MGEIRFNDRVLVLGETGSGKSELLNLLASGLIRAKGAQVCIFDTKPEYAIPGVTPVHDVADIDWTQPVIHVSEEAPDPDRVERYFNVFRSRRRLTIVVHEASDLCDFNAAKTPRSVNAILSKGRKFGLGVWLGSQRPVNISVRARSEAQHVFASASGFVEQADMKAVAAAMGLTVQHLEQHMRQLHSQHGEYAFLHFDRREKTIAACPPLRDAERRAIIVQSPTLY